jgi:hypothetical protein
MSTYQLTLKELITGKGLELTVKAQDIDEAHYKAISRLGTDIVLVNCRELKQC